MRARIELILFQLHAGTVAFRRDALRLEVGDELLDVDCESVPG
jgi:hypothetical protein